MWKENEMICLSPHSKRHHNTIISLIFLGFISIMTPRPALSQAMANSESVPREISSYADAADLVTASPLVIKARIEKRKMVNFAAANTSTAPIRYALLTARVDSLIRGENGIAPVVNFLVRDVPKGTPRPPYMRNKAEVLLFARPGSKAGDIQLTSRSAIQPWNAALETTVRSITGELLQNDSAPAINGIGDAFHIAGTVAGESETQIFLKTSNGAPVSLSIVQRPGQAPHWGVSLGEIVDESAAAPAPGTLLWYRLACGLPAALPPEATRSLPMLDAEAARRDYKLVLESLGSCGRTL